MRLESSMVKVGKETPKKQKGSKVNNPKRLIVVQCWVNIRLKTK
jgi:hypothetical protein